ncbi:DUF4064 domain-containing protein [Listeria aquatica]|uniref:DUF4064 domain-containing protein n=1 Tax=Listeria aquatica FSL S10-1188 TaxID=1265818 RepID=W7APX5_9LIST|nr:DUF4064 domain-containing protein [Listeria aquatica]EUJ17229.1 hypothetical protein MAQA_13655 [Listeria aquatica FSL S10-1188]
MNNRKPEFVMTIIGASLAALGILITGPLLLLILFAATASSMDQMMMSSDDIIGITFGAGFIGLSLVLAIAACVFGFIAAFKMKNGTPAIKGWSIALIVIGALCIFSYGWITGILFLISGIMSLVKVSNEKNHFESF